MLCKAGSGWDVSRKIDGETTSETVLLKNANAQLHRALVVKHVAQLPYHLGTASAALAVVTIFLLAAISVELTAAVGGIHIFLLLGARGTIYDA